MKDEEFEKLQDEVKRGILNIYYEKSPNSMTHDALSRKLIVSPIGGTYGIQGYVLSVQGTPPKGNVFVFTTYRGIFFHDNGINFKNLLNSRLKHVRFISLVDKFIAEIQKREKGKTNAISDSFAIGLM